MKIKKFRAADSQKAMRMIREELGPDVGILACNRVEDGVEFVVTVDAVPDSSPSAGLPADRPQAASAGAETAAPDAAEDDRHFSDDAPKVVWSQDAELLSLKRELGSMRSLLETHLKGQTWEKMALGNPARKAALDIFASLDIDPAIAQQLVEQVPVEETVEIQREVIRSLLIKALPVTTPVESGVVVLVGPPGSGKTTTIAKIAARYVMQGGRDDIALLTTDTARVGAQEQLRAFGRILQVPVHAAASTEEALKTFRLLQKKKLVLVDTAGASFRDHSAIDEQLQLLAALPDPNVLLTLPADTESHALAEVVDAYSHLPLAGTVLTRLDEAVRLGGLLSLLMNKRLPLHWCSNGPRVPRNLFAAEAGKVVGLAFRLAGEFDRSGRDQYAGVSAGGRVSARG